MPLATGQLVIGPLSDRFGRRVPLLLAATVHVVSCLLAAVAPTVEVLTVARVLMGAGAAGGGVVAQATIRDLFGGHTLVRMLARMGLISGLVPVLAPLVGSQLLRFLDWRGLFVSLALYGAARARPRRGWHRRDPAAAGARPRGPRHGWGPLSGRAHRPDLRRRGARRRDAVQRALRLPLDVVVPVPGGLRPQPPAVRPAVRDELARHHHRVADRGARHAPDRSAVDPRRHDRRAVRGWPGDPRARPGPGAALGAAHPLFCFIAAAGFGFPSIQVLGLVHHGEEAGTAASLLGAVNFRLAGLLSPLVGLLGVSTAAPLGPVMASTAAVGVAALWLLVRPRTVPSIER